MSPAVRRALPPRLPRTHAERTAETRERVMAAVVETIADVGFNRATAAEISRRAGVTWGAVQHHFGDKDGILLAVLEESFCRFAAILGDVPAEECLEKRVALFVERSWLHFGSPHYHSTFEILLNLPEESELRWRREMLREWRRIWSRYFRESGVRAGDAPSQQAVELMHYTVAVLSGLATTHLLEGKTARSRGRELGFLKETLTRELEREASLA